MRQLEIRPSYYKQCSDEGKRFLSAAFTEDDLNQECLALIDELGAGFDLGNALKYLWRLGAKGDTTSDLKKAAFYLNRYCATYPGDGPMAAVLALVQADLSE